MIPISPEFNLHMLLLFFPNPERTENPEKGAEVAARHTDRQSADRILQEFISTGNHLVWWARFGFGHIFSTLIMLHL